MRRSSLLIALVVLGMGFNKQLVFSGIRDALFSAFPELLDRTWSTFASEYDLEKGTPEETPEAYPVFEDVVRNVIFELLESGQNEALLARLFVFFESMAKSPDKDVRDLLTIAIFESLVYRPESLRRAWKYMGPESRELAVLEAAHQDRRENLPTE
jgi:hypothetical protein